MRLGSKQTPWKRKRAALFGTMRHSLLSFSFYFYLIFGVLIVSRNISDLTSSPLLDTPPTTFLPLLLNIIGNRKMDEDQHLIKADWYRMVNAQCHPFSNSYTTDHNLITKIFNYFIRQIFKFNPNYRPFFNNIMKY